MLSILPGTLHVIQQWFLESPSPSNTNIKAAKESKHGTRIIRILAKNSSENKLSDLKVKQDTKKVAIKVYG